MGMEKKTDRPTDADLDAMRKAGLSIDGDNAYKRDLLDAVVGAMAFGKQRSKRPPAGHWLEAFYEIGEAEAAERDQLRTEVEALRGDAEIGRLARRVVVELHDSPKSALTHIVRAVDAAMAAKEGE